MSRKNWDAAGLKEALSRGGAKERGISVETRTGRGHDSPRKRNGVEPQGVEALKLRHDKLVRATPAPLSQQFFVPGPLPGANDIIRKHHMVYSSLKVKWGLEIGRCLLIAKIKPIRSCAITYHWIEPIPVRGHIRDRDNIRFGAKFINDALVTHGILLDDGPDGVAQLMDTFEYHSANPGVLITLTEVA